MSRRPDPDQPRRYPLPTLRRKKNGAYFVRIRGRDISLGSNRADARERYDELILEHYPPLPPDPPLAPAQHGPQHADGEHEPQHGPGHQAHEHAGGDEPRGPADSSIVVPIRGALVAEVARLFLRSVEVELDAPARASSPLPASVNRPFTASGYYAKHLRRFLAAWGRHSLARLATAVPTRELYQAPVVSALAALRDDMVADGFAPRTIRHDVKAVARLFGWAAERGYCPAVVFTRTIRLRVPPPRPLPVPAAWIKAQVGRALDSRSAIGHVLGHAMALSYLAALRPTELVRIGHLLQLSTGPDNLDAAADHDAPHPRRRDHPDDLNTLGGLEPLPGAGPGVYAIAGKTTHITHEPRVVVLSPEALEHSTWLRHATLRWRHERPRRVRSTAPPRVFPWESSAAWSSAMRAWTREAPPPGWREPGPVPPSSLRDSAATHLDEAGVPHADRELVLGHVAAGAWRSYNRIAWSRLVDLVARLSLR